MTIDEAIAAIHERRQQTRQTEGVLPEYTQLAIVALLVSKGVITVDDAVDTYRLGVKLGNEGYGQAPGEITELDALEE